MSNKLKGVWVDGLLWESKDFKLIEKHLLQKIKDLDNDKGCTAMNAWFADFLGISKSRVSQLITKLKNQKLISVKLKYNGKEVVGRVIRILKGGMLYFKEGMLKMNDPLSNPKDPSLIFSEESNIVLSNRVNNLVECVEKKDTHIKKIELEKGFLESELEATKKELEKLKSQMKKGKEKSSAKKESGKHQFKDNTPSKSYNPKDMRTNKQLPFDVVSAKKTIDELFPTWQDLETLYDSCYSEKATEEIFKKCMASFIEIGISNYYTGIKQIEVLQKNLLEWVKKEVKFQRNKENSSKPISSSDNGPFLGQVSLAHKNPWNN